MLPLARELTLNTSMLNTPQTLAKLEQSVQQFAGDLRAREQAGLPMDQVYVRTFGELRRCDFFHPVVAQSGVIARAMHQAAGGLEISRGLNRIRTQLDLPLPHEAPGIADDERTAVLYHERLANVRTDVFVEEILGNQRLKDQLFPAGGRALEVGAGYGELAAVMRKRIGDRVRYQSADIGDARKPWVEKEDFFEIVPGQPLREPGREPAELDGQLDTVLAVSVLHHVYPDWVYAQLNEVRQAEQQFKQQHPGHAYGSMQRAYLDQPEVDAAIRAEAVRYLADIARTLKPGGHFVAVEDFVDGKGREGTAYGYINAHDMAACPDYLGCQRAVREWAAIAKEAGLVLVPEYTERFANLSEAGMDWQHVRLVLRKPEAVAS